MTVRLHSFLSCSVPRDTSYPVGRECWLVCYSYWGDLTKL